MDNIPKWIKFFDQVENRGKCDTITVSSREKLALGGGNVRDGIELMVYDGAAEKSTLLFLNFQQTMKLRDYLNRVLAGQIGLGPKLWEESLD